MSNSEEYQARTSRVFSVASLVLGLVALVGMLVYEAACADLGSDLGINTPGFRLLFHWGALIMAGIGMSSAFSALFTASSWRKRLGSTIPGVLVNGATILWFSVLT
jgi:hypothetical protein